MTLHFSAFATLTRLSMVAPKLLTSGTEKSGDEDAKKLSLVEVRAMVEKMNARNWKTIRAHILSGVPAAE